MIHQIKFNLTNHLQVIIRITENWKDETPYAQNYDVFGWVSHSSGGVDEAPETSMRVFSAATMEQALQAPEVAQCFTESIALAYSAEVQAYYAAEYG